MWYKPANKPTLHLMVSNRPPQRTLFLPICIIIAVIKIPNNLCTLMTHKYYIQTKDQRAPINHQISTFDHCSQKAIISLAFAGRLAGRFYEKKCNCRKVQAPSACRNFIRFYLARPQNGRDVVFVPFHISRPSIVNSLC